MLAVSFYLLVGVTLSLIFKQVTFYNYILRKLGEQRGSVVVYKDGRKQRLQVRYWVVSCIFSFFFNLVEKKIVDS